MMSFLGKKRSKEEIYQKAFDSFSFDYRIQQQNDREAAEEDFTEAVKHIPIDVHTMREVDYFA